jgi:hypothetical protein
MRCWLSRRLRAGAAEILGSKHGDARPSGRAFFWFAGIEAVTDRGSQARVSGGPSGRGFHLRSLPSVSRWAVVDVSLREI